MDPAPPTPEQLDEEVLRVFVLMYEAKRVDEDNIFRAGFAKGAAAFCMKDCFQPGNSEISGSERTCLQTCNDRFVRTYISVGRAIASYLSSK
eukprot:TRINITY_DN5980_c0_g1_i1.p1 TRINITY_DN5980_c0_g1~~TRINITY_DN5980_c0_g1_i1.p1  ORF type:complete len:104 (+),score=28.68 TRINITY_DN5980_c0_g1_i1:39-314(+)